MNKPLVLAVALVTAGVSQVLYADQPPPQSQVPAWVAESNQDAQILLKTFADLAPEQAGQFGVDGLDDQASSLTPDFVQRADVALDQDLTQLNAKLAAATDPKLRQDLQIMITAAANAKHDNELQTKYFLNYTNVAQMVFFGVQTLIDPQVPAERQQAVVKRLSPMPACCRAVRPSPSRPRCCSRTI